MEEATLILEDERKLELGATEDGALELDLRLELAGTLLDPAMLDAATLDVIAPEQTAPATVGTCALLPPLVPCTPNSTLEPTAILLFQFSGAAV